MNIRIMLRWAPVLVGLVLVLGALPSLANGRLSTEALASGSFVDELDVQLRLKLDGRRTQVMNVEDSSRIVTVRITADGDARIPWHTHSGPVLVTVQDGQLTYVDEDCRERVYPAGTAFVDPGQGNVHAAFVTDGTVLVATFLGVEGAPSTPVEEPTDCEPEA